MNKGSRISLLISGFFHKKVDSHRMHILEIPSFFMPYGGEFCLDQAKALKEQDHKVRILSNVQLSIKRDLDGYLSLPFGREEHVMDGITVIQSYQRGIPKVVKPNVNRWVKIVQSMFRKYVAKYGQPDVLHAHCAKWAGYAAMLISKEYGIPYVITEHLSPMSLKEEFGEDLSKAWQLPMLRKAYEEAAMVLPVSEELVEATACYYGEDYRWQAVSNVIDTTLFRYQERKPFGHRPFVFCCVANFEQRKGYEVLAEAFREVCLKNKQVRLHIAGQGTDSPECAELMAGLAGVKGYGRMSRKEVARLMYRSDALVLPSLSEVQPLVLLEAMSTGIPVIATESTPRSLRIKGGCHIVPIGDADALAEAMLDMCDHYEFDGRAISEAINRMASPEVIGEQLSEIFAEAQHHRP